MSIIVLGWRLGGPSIAVSPDREPTECVAGDQQMRVLGYTAVTTAASWSTAP